MMGRIRVEENRKIESWEEANEALRDLALLELETKHLDLDAKEEVKKIQAELSVNLGKVKLRKDEIELILKLFCDAHRKDFGEKKSRDMLFGKVSYRDQSKVVDRLPVNEIVALIKKEHGDEVDRVISILVAAIVSSQGQETLVKQLGDKYGKLIDQLIEILKMKEIVALVKHKYHATSFNPLLRVTQNPDKNAITKLSDNEVRKLGCEREREQDVFGYTPNWKEIKKIEEEG